MGVEKGPSPILWYQVVFSHYSSHHTKHIYAKTLSSTWTKWIQRLNTKTEKHINAQDINIWHLLVVSGAWSLKGGRELLLLCREQFPGTGIIMAPGRKCASAKQLAQRTGKGGGLLTGKCVVHSKHSVSVYSRKELRILGKGAGLLRQGVHETR